MNITSFRGKKFTFLLSAAMAGLFVALLPVVIMAFDPGPPSSDPNFEIDVPAANALDEAVYAGDDWETVYKCFEGGDGYDATIKYTQGYATNNRDVIAPSNSITLNTWQHVAVTHDNSSPSNMIE